MYPNLTECDYVRVYEKGKGNYTSRKESTSQWTDKQYQVILAGKDMMSNKYYTLNGLSRRYNRHELLLVDD